MHMRCVSSPRPVTRLSSWRLSTTSIPTRSSRHSARLSFRLRHERRSELHSAADPSLTSPAGDDRQDTPTAEVFPRIRESDPYRLLGLSTEATFEEIQDARNYYYETYREHEASREAIEDAFDRVLSEHMQKRKKFGFRAAKLGRKSGALEDDVPRKSLIQRFLELFEPSVPLTAIVNDGVICLLLSFWAAGTQYATQDPTGPFVVTIGFCTWRLFDKRQKRRPDGPFFGGSPIWGALGTTFLAFLLASFLAIAVVPICPWPPSFPSEAFGACLAILVIGYVSIFVK